MLFRSLVDIAKNVTAIQGEYQYLPLAEHPNHGRLATLLRRSNRDLKNPEPNRGDIDKLLELIAQSQRPMVLVGGGVIRSRGAVPEFRRFIETLDAPVGSTIMGGGACPGNHPLFTGMVGIKSSVTKVWVRWMRISFGRQLWIRNTES